MALVFWQTTPSPHQQDLLKAVASCWKGKVYLGYEQDLPGDRQAFGWKAPEFEGVEVLDVRDPENWRHLAALRGPGDVHVFTGFLYHPCLRRAFRALSDSGAKRFLYSESVDFQGWRGAARWGRDRLRALLYRKAIHGVLGIGSLGVGYFRSLGFAEERLHCFGYYVKSAELPRQEDRAGVYRLMYAGQLIRRKGVDRLLRTLARCLDREWTLTLVGAGPEESALRTSAAALGLANRVVWRGPLNRVQVAQELSSADLCLVPSRWDGWAVVVEESLLQGTPVLCSSLCGARDLISVDERGGVFDDEDTLLRLLRDRLSSPRQRCRYSDQVSRAALQLVTLLQKPLV